MESLPYPPLPTEQEIIREEKTIRDIVFFTPPLLLVPFLLLALLTALCMAYNFNPMQWLE